MATAKTPNGILVDVVNGTDPTGYNRPYTYIKYQGIRLIGFADDDPTNLIESLKRADEIITKTLLR